MKVGIVVSLSLDNWSLFTKIHKIQDRLNSCVLAPNVVITLKVI